MSPLYADMMDLGIGMPAPDHTLTESAEKARQAHRRYGYDRHIERVLGRIVTEHGNPKPVPYLGVVVPAAARAFAKKLEVADFEVQTLEYRDGCIVEGIDRAGKRGVRAQWHRGKAAGGTWHSGGRDRYVLVEDHRPVGINKISRTALANRRGAGMGRVRLKLVESPRGIPLNITELEKRISA